MSEIGSDKGAKEFLAMVEGLNGLVSLAHGTAKEKGWWDDPHFNIPEKLALIHSEVSEALEDYRDPENGPTMVRFTTSGKPEGFGVELADVIIRIADLCGRLGIDLGELVAIKMKYNESRPHRHGGKRA